MEITGRLVADATVRETGTDRKVTGFRIAVNRRYQSQGEPKEETAFIDCSYWRSEAIAPFLTKGMIVQVSGFITARAWLNGDGEPVAGLDFRTDQITMLSKSNKKKPAAAKRGEARQAGDRKGVMQPSEQFN